MLMAKVSLVFANLLLIFGSIEPIEVDCDYNLERIYIFAPNFICRCDVQNDLNITSKYSRVITSANGAHKGGKSNENVESFAVNNKSVRYFPQNLQNVFKNLKRISIQEGRLKELNQNDLKPLTKLVELSLAMNDIEVLEDGVFDYNLELTHIDLDMNKIVHIGRNVFEGLNKLTCLDIQSNICIDMNAENNLKAVVEIIKITKTNCTNAEFVALEMSLKELEAEYRYIVAETFDDFHQKVVNLQQEYENSTFLNLSSVNDKIQLFSNLNAQPMWMMKEQLKQMEKAMKDSNKQLMKRIAEMEGKSNFIDITTSGLSIWIIVGAILIIVLVVVYRKACSNYEMPIMMI